MSLQRSWRRGSACGLLAAAALIGALAVVHAACDGASQTSLLPAIGGSTTDESDVTGGSSDGANQGADGGAGGGADASTTDSQGGGGGQDSSGGDAPADDGGTNGTDAPGGGDDQSGDDGGDASSNDAPNAPPPPLLPPAPRRSVFTYTPDGSYRISSGPLPNPYFQSRLMAVIPKFAAYGFGRYVSMTYQGNARSLADATGYYDPIVSVANANGVQFVPGFWMADIFANVYGPEDLPPWNVGVGSYNHPMNPSGLLNPAFWTEFVTRAEILAKGAHSTQVFVEAEGVFWYHKEEPFWSNANLAQIKPLFRQAVADLRSRGVTLIMYHPWPIYTVDVCVRQTQYLLSPNNPADPADPMNCVEHFAPSPYFRVTNYTPPEPADIIGYYTIVGLSGEYVRYGFMSNHAGSHCFTPQQYHDWCVARPGVEDKTWYFSGTSLFEQHAQDFLNISLGQNGGGAGGTVGQPI